MQPIINYFTNASKTKIAVWFIVLSIAVVAIIVASFFAWDYYVTQKLVTLNPSPGTTITIGEGGHELEISKQIVNTSSKQVVRLRSGVYVVKFAGTKEYQEITQSITISQPTEIKTPALNYTSNKLGQLLKSENLAIQKVIAPTILNQNYTIDNGTLFSRGEWYGARLKPAVWYNPTMAVKNLEPVSGNHDMLRIILTKTSGQWKVAAEPSIIFAIDDYPNIPPDVIRSTNQLGFN